MGVHINENIYECRKEVLRPDGVKRICHYTGGSEEFVKHMRMTHMESCFVLSSRILFQWKFPFVGDQMDICLLGSDDLHYLYKIYYSQESCLFRHIFTNISKDDTQRIVEVINLDSKERSNGGICQITQPMDMQRNIQWSIDGASLLKLNND